MANRYLEGNFGPVPTELTVTDLAVTGRIPAQLNGRYLRNGPNPVRLPDDPSHHHWFVGDGMVHGVRLHEGRARWYRNRWVRAGEVARALGEPARPGPSHGGFDFAANTNVVGLAGRTYALVEAGSLPYELTYELETVGASDLAGTLPNGFTAHPHVDPDTGELHAVNYWWGFGNALQYVVVGPDGRVRHSTMIETPGSLMVHDCGLSSGHVLVFDLPVVFSLERAAAGAGMPYQWDDAYTARIGVLPKFADGSQVRWFDVEPCYVFHPMNCFEDAGRVVMDACRHERTFDTNAIGPDEGVPPTLDRWSFDLSSGKVATERLDDRGQEFPRFDERRQGKPYRYGYAVGFEADRRTGLTIGGVLAHDLAAGTTTARLDARYEWAEVVFVPRSADAPEGDGWLMGYRYDREADTSDLVILRADDVAGEPEAVVHLPRRVPNGFHGNWAPDPA